MNGASKILTVSYGTFSCTLEGFDEPFNTMKAIAEYFRDLASEDRYFGAEPPTPDAAMLHRIAEREIQRRVEARIEDNGVVLRAGDQLPMVQIAPQAVAAPGLAVQPASLAGQTGNESESVAARLAQVRADRLAVERDTVVLERPLAANDDALPALAPVGAGDPVLHDDIAGLDDLPAEFAAGLDDLAADDQAPAERAETDVVAAFEAAQEADLRDPVSTDADPGFDIADLDLDALQGLTAAKDIAGLPAPDPVPAGSPAMADDLATADADDDADDRLMATLGAMIDPEDDDLTNIDPAGYDSADLAPSVPEAEDLAPAGDPAPADDLASLAVPSPDAPGAEPPETADSEPAADADTDAYVTEAPATERLQRARARVIKIRRPDAAADLPPPPAAPLLATPEPAAPRPAAPASLLSDEAEAELQRELAAFEADAAPLATPSAPAATDRLNGLDKEVAVDRLMAQTNSAMEGPENKRRLSAIAHLKAAVAATVADRKVNPNASAADDRTDAYRDDLNRVVRPRRPGAPADRPAPLVLVSEQRIDRKPATAPEPVAALALTGAPIRPRRVRAGAMALQAMPATMADPGPEPEAMPARTAAILPAPGAATARIADQLDDEFDAEDMGNIFAAGPDEGFTDFAERLGAQSMPDLLEAAGAYCTLVLDRPQFSRPLLLAQLSRLPGAETFTREDSLRGFGSLLRHGRIVKIKRGQFTLPEGSRALADAKRFAG